MTRKTFPCILALTAALALAACTGGDDSADTAAVTATVATVPLRQGSLPEQVTAYGAAGPAADAAQTINVRAAGRVTHWNVTAGAPVKRGQPLLTFELSPADVAAYQQALGAQQLAATQRAHVAALLAQQLATRDQLDQADKALEDAQSNLDALRQQQGSGKTMQLAAPFDGTVATVDAAQGEALQAGAALLSVQRGDGLVITVGVERAALARVQVGDQATLTPLDAAPALRGTVVRVGRALNAHTHQIDVDIAPDAAPIAGEGFRADIVVGQWQGWLLPRDAVLGDADNYFVFQVANGKAVRVPVKIVGESSDTSVATGKLDAGQPLVTAGATQLDDGMAVRIAAPDARP